MTEHRCEAMALRQPVTIMRVWLDDSNEDWVLYCEDHDDPQPIIIRYCPFCGQKLGEGEDA